MARIRTVKPEFWSSEQMIECSPLARLLFIGMWNFCDDGGIHTASYVRIKAEVFPVDNITIPEIKSLINELISQGLIFEYEHSGSLFWMVTGWERHQKIDRPNAKYPPPSSQLLEEFTRNNSTSPRRMLDESSTSPRRVLDESSTPEGKGREGKGKERKGKEETISSEANSLPHSPIVPTEEIFISLLLIDGSEFHVCEPVVQKYEKCYPGIDVRQSLRQICAWCISNPKKRKTRKGILRCVNQWLSTNQDKSGFMNNQTSNSKPLNNFDKNQLVLDQILREEDEKHGKQNLIESGVTYDHDG